MDHLRRAKRHPGRMSVSNPASAEFHTQRASRSDTDKISTVLQKRDPLSILPTGHPARVLPVVLSAMARGAARDGLYYVLSASGRFRVEQSEAPPCGVYFSDLLFASLFRIHSWLLQGAHPSKPGLRGVPQLPHRITPPTTYSSGPWCHFQEPWQVLSEMPVAHR
jgi:hypothetical protein